MEKMILRNFEIVLLNFTLFVIYTSIFTADELLCRDSYERGRERRGFSITGDHERTEIRSLDFWILA